MTTRSRSGGYKTTKVDERQAKEILDAQLEHGKTDRSLQRKLKAMRLNPQTARIQLTSAVDGKVNVWIVPIAVIKDIQDFMDSNGKVILHGTAPLLNCCSCSDRKKTHAIDCKDEQKCKCPATKKIHRNSNKECKANEPYYFLLEQLDSHKAGKINTGFGRNDVPFAANVEYNFLALDPVGSCELELREDERPLELTSPPAEQAFLASLSR